MDLTKVLYLRHCDKTNLIIQFTTYDVGTDVLTGYEYIKGEHWWRKKIYIQIKHKFLMTPVYVIFHRDPPLKRYLGFFIFFCPPCS